MSQMRAEGGREGLEGAATTSPTEQSFSWLESDVLRLLSLSLLSTVLYSQTPIIQNENGRVQQSFFLM